MSIASNSIASNSSTITDADLDARFGPIFERIAEGAVEREVDRRLAHTEVGWLREAGFTALRVPTELGGLGVTVRQQFRLLIDLAATESAGACRPQLSTRPAGV